MFLLRRFIDQESLILSIILDLNHFSFCKPFSFEAKSLSNNPNAFDNEDEAIDRWWNKGLNAKEINLRLEEKRKKYFSRVYRYNLITKKFKVKPLQWKIAFLNSNINGHPQSKEIKEENVERFILQLKVDNLFAELEDEFDELLEFEKMYLASVSLMKEICYASTTLRIINNNYIPTNFLHNNLAAKKVEDIFMLKKVDLLEDFCGNAKLKQDIWYNLVNCSSLSPWEKITNWKSTKIIFARLNCFEPPIERLKRIFIIALQEANRRKYIERINSRIKNKNKIKEDEFKMLSDMMNNKFKFN
jgi:hypothetical protein